MLPSTALNRCFHRIRGWSVGEDDKAVQKVLVDVSAHD
jgi:hypothetical protein